MIISDLANSVTD